MKYNWRMIIVCIIPFIITICLESSLTKTLDNLGKSFLWKKNVWGEDVLSTPMGKKKKNQRNETIAFPFLP